MNLEGHKAFAMNAYLVRRKNFWSQEHVAEKAGLQRLAYQKFENLLSFPRGDSLEKIAKALETPISDLYQPLEIPDSLFRNESEKEDWENLLTLTEVYQKVKAIRRIYNALSYEIPKTFPELTRDITKDTLLLREYLGYSPDEPLSNFPKRLWGRGIVTAHFHSIDPKESFLSLRDAPAGPTLVILKEHKTQEERFFTYVWAYVALVAGKDYGEGNLLALVKSLILPPEAFQRWSQNVKFYSQYDRVIALKAEYFLTIEMALSYTHPGEEIGKLKADVLIHYEQHTASKLRRESDLEALSHWKHLDDCLFLMLRDAKIKDLITEDELSDLTTMGRVRRQIVLTTRSRSAEEANNPESPVEKKGKSISWKKALDQVQKREEEYPGR